MSFLAHPWLEYVFVFQDVGERFAHGLVLRIATPNLSVGNITAHSSADNGRAEEELTGRQNKIVHPILKVPNDLLDIDDLVVLVVDRLNNPINVDRIDVAGNNLGGHDMTFQLDMVESGRTNQSGVYAVPSQAFIGPPAGNR
jgi:hypothetical protein